LITAIVLDAVALGAFLMMKGQSDPLIVVIALVGIGAIFAFEHFYLSKTDDGGDTASSKTKD
jgi:hypothetical protein